jgi:hypothetical protein
MLHELFTRYYGFGANHFAARVPNTREYPIPWTVYVVTIIIIITFGRRDEVWIPLSKMFGSRPREAGRKVSSRRNLKVRAI